MTNNNLIMSGQREGPVWGVIVLWEVFALPLRFEFVKNKLSVSYM